MQGSHIILLLGVLLLSILHVQGRVYNLQTVYSGANLYSTSLWDYFTGADPTHGNVEYLGYNDAMANGLLSYTTLGTNYYNTFIRSSRGNQWGYRKSVRISSKATWNRGLFVMEFSHMPSGCSTWPAFWMLNRGQSWPTGGEIDIVEGVNNGNANSATLHTINGCNMDNQAGNGNGNGFTGHWKAGSDGTAATNCWINEPTQYANQGCSIEGSGTSYGAAFNNGGGGTYALELTDSYIKVFFFPHSAGHVWEASPNPDTWGTPQARFNFGGNCPASYFYNLQLILDLTFCGDWAGGGVFSSMCGGDCATYINNNHATLDQNAYWAINSITTYT